MENKQQTKKASKGMSFLDKCNYINSFHQLYNSNIIDPNIIGIARKLINKIDTVDNNSAWLINYGFDMVYRMRNQAKPFINQIKYGELWIKGSSIEFKNNGNYCSSYLTLEQCAIINNCVATKETLINAINIGGNDFMRSFMREMPIGFKLLLELGQDEEKLRLLNEATHQNHMYEMEVVSEIQNLDNLEFGRKAKNQNSTLKFIKTTNNNVKNNKYF